MNKPNRKSRESKPKWDKSHQLALDALTAGARIGPAAIAAGVGRTTLWAWRNEDPEYAAAFDEARITGRICRAYQAEDYLDRASDEDAEITKQGVAAAMAIVKGLLPTVYNPPQRQDVNHTGELIVNLRL